MTPLERLEKYQAVDPPSYEVKPPQMRGFHGASGTRTRALLGAIQPSSYGVRLDSTSWIGARLGSTAWLWAPAGPLR
jgi:hypothetical protein